MIQALRFDCLQAFRSVFHSGLFSPSPHALPSPAPASVSQETGHRLTRMPLDTDPGHRPALTQDTCQEIPPSLLPVPLSLVRLEGSSSARPNAGKKGLPVLCMWRPERSRFMPPTGQVLFPLSAATCQRTEPHVLGLTHCPVLVALLSPGGAFVSCDTSRPHA